MCCKIKNKLGKYIFFFKYKIKYRENKVMKCIVERFLFY